MQSILAADTLTGATVVNRQKEDLGKIEHPMIDVEKGRIAYAVLSFGGFLGMGDKLFAIPWSALQVGTADRQLILDVDKKLLEHAPGFNKAHWPNMADRAWGAEISTYYGAKPYWTLESGPRLRAGDGSPPHGALHGSWLGHATRGVASGLGPTSSRTCSTASARLVDRRSG